MQILNINNNLKNKKMKKIIPVVFIISSIIAFSCNGNSSSSKEEHNQADKMKEMPMDDSASAGMNTDVKTVAVTYSNVDTGVASFMKEMVQDYVAVKNALTDGNGAAAAAAAKKMNDVMKKMDKSLFTAEQKEIYDNIEDDLKENAEHIGKNEDKIQHQRDHFATMSQDMYSMVKAFGAGITLFHDHCPMANDGKGAMWLSEAKEIRNPYYGDEMMTCGSVEEMFK
jgi:hypothetical protein